MDIIENNWLRIEVSPKGAEIQSIRGKNTLQEYIWHGDGVYWGRRSPLLFPNVGRLYNDEARIDGQVYPLPKHGIVKDETFKLVARTDAALTYQLNSTPQMEKVFPFRFSLKVDYKLRGARLEVLWTVRNLAGRPMPFHIGGHPGFMLPAQTTPGEVKAYLKFDTTHHFHSATTAASGCLGEQYYFLPMQDGLLPVTNALFDRDVIIDEYQCSRVALLTQDKMPYLTVESSAPCTLIWSPKGKNAPFVCIEPWFGLCDAHGYEGDWQDRPYTQTIAPGRQTRMGYKFQVDCEKIPNFVLNSRKAGAAGN